MSCWLQPQGERQVYPLSHWDLFTHRLLQTYSPNACTHMHTRPQSLSLSLPLSLSLSHIHTHAYMHTSPMDPTGLSPLHPTFHQQLNSHCLSLNHIGLFLHLLLISFTTTEATALKRPSVLLICYMPVAKRLCVRLDFGNEHWATRLIKKSRWRVVEISWNIIILLSVLGYINVIAIEKSVIYMFICMIFNKLSFIVVLHDNTTLNNVDCENEFHVK